MLDSDRLEAFVAFGESLNLTRAAEALHIAQPSLHAKLAKLADEVGAPLYRREGRRLVLTPVGEELLCHGRDAKDRDGRFLASLRGTAARPIVLAAGAGSLRYLLSDGIGRYLVEPPAPLRLWTRDADETSRAVRDGRAHLGAGVVDPAGLDSAVLAEIGASLLVPEGHRLAGRKQARLRDLEGEELIVPPAGRPQRRALDEALRGVAWTVGVEARGWDLALHLAGMGLGAAVVNEFCAPPLGMVALALPDLGAVTYRVVWRQAGLPAAGQRLRDELLREGQRG